MSNIVGAETPKKEEPQQKQYIEDVHIGVFFEGTILNMVGNVCYKTYKRVRLFSTDQYSELKGAIKSQKAQQKSEKKDTTTPKKTQQEKLAEHITPEILCDREREGGMSYGFSNIAFLYSLFDVKKSESCVYEKFYIEGSGSTDVSSKIDSSPIGGPFGVGGTGVVALVAKAVKRITAYINSLNAEFDMSSQKPNLHFYVFGFSRGSVCGRLFCHLLTRIAKDSTPLECEKDFSKSYGAATFMKDGKLEFLEEYKCENKITVDFLGIYDTVASIGVLQRKDGSSPLHLLDIGVATTAAGSEIGGVVGSKVGDQLGKMIDEKWGAIGKILGSKVVNDQLGKKVGSKLGSVAGAKCGAAITEKITVHYNNVDEFGLYISPVIKSICHLCAMDEYEENFALVNLGKSVPGNAVEVMIPGCHSDVGGSFLNMEGEKAEYVKIKGRGKKICYSPSNVRPTDRNIGDFCAASLKEAGWVNDTTATARDDGDYVKMTRNIKRGYSDIPLAMMRKYFCKKVGEGFFGNIPDEHDYRNFNDSFKDMKKVGDRMLDELEKISGGRHWFVPNTADYKSLRSKFLHFSAQSDLGHPPSYDNSVMCRMTYHGDKGEPEGAVKRIHFLHELYDKSKIVQL